MSFVMPPDFGDAAKLSQAPTPMDESITPRNPYHLADPRRHGFARLGRHGRGEEGRTFGSVEASDVWKAAMARRDRT